MNQMYYIDDGTLYLASNVSNDIIQWARAVCALEGFKLVFLIE